MTAAIHLYRTLTQAASPFLGGLMKRRARAGKEDYGRINERLARNMPRRMPGGTLVWLHGASVGESQLLLELGQRLLEKRPDLLLLFTSQTQTSARLLGPALPDRAIHLMAPLDTPAIARRFIQHWQPDLCIFGEGEFWPNLILEAEKSGAKRALVNGRMTDSSAEGWQKLSRAFQRLVGRFDVVLAADTDTARRLETLLEGGFDQRLQQGIQLEVGINEVLRVFGEALQDRQHVIVKLKDQVGKRTGANVVQIELLQLPQKGQQDLQFLR